MWRMALQDQYPNYLTIYLYCYLLIAIYVYPFKTVYIFTFLIICVDYEKEKWGGGLCQINPVTKTGQRLYMVSDLINQSGSNNS